MKCVITGGAGFIGTHLAEQLLICGNQVVCVDNFLLGKQEYILYLYRYKNFFFVKCDVADFEYFNKVVEKEKPDIIYHLAANSDIKKGENDPEIDFKNTFYTTYSVLKSMRVNHIKKLFFASTSAVYGEKIGVKLAEDEGILTPISYYGGSKLASENFISCFAFMNNIDVVILRFSNIIGPNLTHGVVYDFIKKLEYNKEKLEILGDGQQKKPYLYVTDLIEAIMCVTQKIKKGVQIYNVGVESSTSVNDIADMVCKRLGLKNVQYQYTEGKCGWKGDIPSFEFNLSKIHKLGWRARYTSNEAVERSINEISIV